MIRAVLVCESWIDQGKKIPAGSKSTEMYTAQATIMHSPLLRKGVKVVPKVDKQVPVAAFIDDVRRKLKLRKAMKSSEAEPMVQGMHALSTKEDVNYRYAENPMRSCGKCTHFLFPGACDIVAGLIRTVDVCNEFEAKDDPTRRQASPVVQASFIDSAKKESTVPGTDEHAAILSDQGWQFHANDHDTIVYTNPETDEEIRVWDSGNWIRYTADQHVISQGQGVESLRQDLSVHENEGGPGSGVRGHVTDRPEGGGNGKPDGWVSDPMMKKELVSIGGQTHEIKMRTDKETGDKLMNVAGQDIAQVRVTSEQIPGPVGRISIGSSNVTYVKFKPEGLAKLIGPERAAMFPTSSMAVKNIRGAKYRFSNLLTTFTKRGQQSEGEEGGPGSGPRKGDSSSAKKDDDSSRVIGQRARPPIHPRAGAPMLRYGLSDRENEEGGPGSGRRPGGKTIYAKQEPEGDDERQIATFTRREKPTERRDRIKGKKVDPAQAKAIQRAFLVVRASLVSAEAMSTMGAHSAISDMPGSDAQDYTAPGLRHGRRGAA